MIRPIPAVSGCRILCFGSAVRHIIVDFGRPAALTGAGIAINHINLDHFGPTATAIPGINFT